MNDPEGTTTNADRSALLLVFPNAEFLCSAIGPRPKGAAMSSDFITTEEFCARTSMANSTVRKKIRTGVIPSVKIGGRRRIPTAYLDQLLAEAYGHRTDADAWIDEALAQ